jgi:hypothetical protein
MNNTKGRLTSKNRKEIGNELRRTHFILGTDSKFILTQTQMESLNIDTTICHTIQMVQVTVPTWIP